MTERIFISYRRDDSFPEAALICTALQARAGTDCVFMDKSLQPGADWPDEIQNALLKADTVLVVVKNWNKWLGIQEFGNRRIDDPKDWVHQELALALKKKKKTRTIPVVIGTPAGTIPRDMLPEGLRQLTEKQRHLLRMDSWDQDLKSLVDALCPVPILVDSSQDLPSRSAEPDENEWLVVVRKYLARLKNMVAWVVAAALVLAALCAGYLIHQHHRDQEATRLVEGLLTSPSGRVEAYLNQLESFQDVALEKLRHEFNNQMQTSIQRLHAAYGLARLGAAERNQWLFLLDSVSGRPEEGLPELANDESANLITALSALGDEFAQDLKTAVRQRIEASSDDAKSRNRYLVIAVSLGLKDLAMPVCKIQDEMYDPQKRTSFLDGFRDFPGELMQVAAVLDQPDLDPDLRSALCLAIGRMGKNARDATHAVIQKLYVEASDGDTHSAARWALLQQGLTEAQLDKLLGQRPEASDRDWYVIPDRGITMVKIPGGSFALGDVTDDENPTEMDEPESFAPFWMSDREISVGQFEEMMPDVKLKRDANASVDLTELLKPAAEMTWFDAIAFCNRLSKIKKLQPYYNVDEDNATKDEVGHITEAQVSIIDGKGHGYRLPTEAEWESACRAMSSMDYCYGDSVALLPDYAVFQSNASEVCGRRIPNAWGLFDMHGNVEEWCWDNFDSSGDNRVLRGGSFYFLPQLLRSAFRVSNSPEFRNFNYVGFRISRTP